MNPKGWDAQVSERRHHFSATLSQELLAGMIIENRGIADIVRDRVE